VTSFFVSPVVDCDIRALVICWLQQPCRFLIRIFFINNQTQQIKQYFVYSYILRSASHLCVCHYHLTQYFKSSDNKISIMPVCHNPQQARQKNLSHSMRGKTKKTIKFFTINNIVWTSYMFLIPKFIQPHNLNKFGNKNFFYSQVPSPSLSYKRIIMFIFFEYLIYIALETKLAMPNQPPCYFLKVIWKHYSYLALFICSGGS
jgi:hypothetical protein